MDTTPVIRVTKENVWQCYEKVSDYEAKCRFCRENFVYINLQSEFYSHVKLHIDILKYEESYGRQEWPWICFKYNNTTTSRCLLCKSSYANILSNFQALAYHLYRKHFNEMNNYVLHSWIWKYYIIGDFKMKCTDCSSELCFSLSDNLNLHIIMKHSDELTNVQEMRDVNLSLETVQRLKIMEVLENLWNYYTKLSFFKVKCELQCLFVCTFLNTDFLFAHMIVYHRAIFEWEKIHEDQKWPWMYFKYSFEYISDKNIPYSECLMCGKFFSTSSASTIDHILDEHSEKERQDFTDDLWIRKYFRGHDDPTEIKCTICYKKIVIKINPHVLKHTIKDHSEKVQFNISKKNTQKLWQKYILANLQAKCRSCDFKSCYVNITNFSKHVKKEHQEIYNHEEAYGHKYPWTNFTYLPDYSSYKLQCRFCNNTLQFSSELLLIRHLQSERCRNIFIKRSFDMSLLSADWIWKYCKQNSEFKVQCNICRCNIVLDVLLWRFNCHIEDCHTEHSNRLTNTEKTYDIVGPSKSN